MRGEQTFASPASQNRPYPESDFKPIIIDKNILNQSSPAAGLIFESFPTFSKTEGELKLEEYNIQADKIVESMKQNPDLFGDKLINDIKRYYPIYKVVGDYYRIDWKILWVVH